MNKILIIGNVIYENYEKLESVEYDINRVKSAFKELEYEVTVHLDLTYGELENELQNFSKNVKEKDNLIIFFSGHSFHKNGHNYVLVKDSPVLPNVKIDSEFYKMYEFFDVEKFTTLASLNIDGDSLVIIDACRVEESKEFEQLKEVITMTNKVWQLYSTSKGRYSYANGLFVDAIIHTVFRYGQNIAELYEAICCYMSNNCVKKEMQVPILISGNKIFSIVREFNMKVEKQYFQDWINIYSEVRKEIKKYGYPYTADIKNEIANEINMELCFSNDKIKEKVDKVCEYMFAGLGIIDLLIDENLREIRVYNNRFSLHGICSNFSYKNDNLYNYDECLDYIKNKSKVVSDFMYKYGRITCLNYELNSSEKSFILIINKNKKYLRNYIDEYYQCNNNHANRIYNTLREIFLNRESVIISGARYIDTLSFVSSLLDEYLQRSNVICELVHLTEIENSKYQIEKIEFEKIFGDLSIYQELISKIEENKFDLIVFPLMAYHECSMTLERMEVIKKIEMLAQENNIPFIFYTDYVIEGISIMDITKQALPYTKYVINLEKDKKNNMVYIEAVKKSTEYVEN